MGASFLGEEAAGAGVGAGAEVLLGLALPNLRGTFDLGAPAALAAPGAAAGGGGVCFLAGSGAPPNSPANGLLVCLGASFLGAGAAGAGIAAGLGAVG